jgi:hypothetical protein
MCPFHRGVAFGQREWTEPAEDKEIKRRTARAIWVIQPAFFQIRRPSNMALKLTPKWPSGTDKIYLRKFLD